MEHQQDKNAFAYVIYERPTARVVKEGVEVEWIRSLMFYADDPSFSSRDAVWEHNVGWRNPKNIRVVPLYDEDANNARREACLDAINAQYERETGIRESRKSLCNAVESALETTDVELERFEGLIKTLEAFDYMITEPLSVPPHTVQRTDYLASVQEIHEFVRKEGE